MVGQSWGAETAVSILEDYCILRTSFFDPKNIPGTIIPVVDEKIMFQNQPDYALILSWHIADELIPKLKEKGYQGKFIIPLPNPKIIT